MGGFQQAAEVLLADVMKGSLAGGEALDGLVFHFQPLEMQDAEIFLAAFPDLVLLQSDFPGHAKVSGKMPVSPDSESGETRRTAGYFFFFLATGFFLAALLTLDFLAIILFLSFV
jgi:hypothetical protein